MYVQAGAGIVADSDPDFEQQECINKAAALFRAAEEAKRFAPPRGAGSKFHASIRRSGQKTFWLPARTMPCRHAPNHSGCCVSATTLQANISTQIVHSRSER